jgi:hypothetical protein
MSGSASWPRSVVAMTWRRKWRCLWRGLAPMCTNEAAAQAAESAVCLLAEDRRRHEATELATMSPMRSLTALRDHTNIEAIAYEAPALPTTTSPEPPAMLSLSPRPTSFIWAQSSIPTGGGIRCRIRRRLPWRFQHHVPSSKRCWLRGCENAS